MEEMSPWRMDGSSSWGHRVRALHTMPLERISGNSVGECLSRQGKDEYRWRAGVAAPPKGRRTSGHHRDVLLPFYLIRNHAAADRPTGLKPMQKVAGHGIQHYEMPGQFPTKHHASRGSGHRCDYRLR